jgi:hypothetical protein
MPSTGKPEDRYFRDYPVSGHIPDILTSAILGPSSGVHFSLECFVIALLARAFAAWRPRGDVKRGTKKELDDDDQPVFYMLAAGRFAAKYVKDTDDEERDSQDE